MFHEPSNALAWRAVGVLFTSGCSSAVMTVCSPPPMLTALVTVIQRDMKRVALESINKRMPSHVAPACTDALTKNCRSYIHTQRNVCGNSFPLIHDMSQSSRCLQTWHPMLNTWGVVTLAQKAFWCTINTKVLRSNLDNTNNNMN